MIKVSSGSVLICMARVAMKYAGNVKPKLFKTVKLVFDDSLLFIAYTDF
jgi:hypothetical protein